MASSPDLYPEPELQSTLRGHKQAINCLSFSPDGQQLVSGSDDNSVILWSLKDKQSICYRLAGHSNSVLSVAFSERFILSASKDCSVRLWKLNKINSTTDQNDSFVYRCHTSSVRSVDIHPDRTQFCTASDDKTVKIWSSSGPNKFVSSLSGMHCNWVRCARYSKLNTHLIASCGDDGLVCVWDTRTREAVIKLEPKRRSSHCLSLTWHPVHQQLLSTSGGDASIKIWDLRQQKIIQYYAAHDSAVNSVDFHQTGNYLLSSSSDERCKIFDLLEGRVLFTLNAHNGPVNCAAFSTNGEYFATAGHDKQIQFWKSNLLAHFDFDDSIANGNQLTHRDIDDDIERHDHITQAKFLNKRPLKSALKLSSDDASQDKKQLQSILSPAKIDSMLNQDGDRIPAQEVLGMCQRILSQVQILTESVSVIERRLSILEGKFEAHCTTENSLNI